MNELSDQQLLRAYADSKSDRAFSELVRRHAGLVYSASLRMVRDSHLAEDVTQSVFLALARNSGHLADHPVLGGWLHRTTHNIAAQTVRTDVRRRGREEEAVAMGDLSAGDEKHSWEEIAAHLDAAVEELSESERDAILLRFFQARSAREIGDILGLSPEAAQKRVSRAVEHLRDLFAERGVVVGSMPLVALMTANSVQAIPAALVASISSAVAASGLASISAATASKTLIMTTVQKASIAAALTAAIGMGIYEARTASALQRQLVSVQRLQSSVNEELADARSENVRLSNIVAQTKVSPALPRAELSELLRLRSQASVARGDSQEIARLQSALAEQERKVPPYLTNALASGLSVAEAWKKKDSAARLERMKGILKLTPEQEQSISNIFAGHLQEQSKMAMELMTGKITPDQAQSRKAQAARDQETEIRSQLSEQQLAKLPEYEQAQKVSIAEEEARTEARRLTEEFKLSGEQADKIRSSLFELSLREQISNGVAAGSIADELKRGVEQQRAQLDEKLRILESVLSSEQLARYREVQTRQMEMQAAAMKAFLPQGKTN